MFPPKLLLAFLLVCSLSAVYSTIDSGSPSDPRCNKCNGPTEEREFEVEALGVFGDGVFETDIVADDNFYLDGTFVHKKTLSPELPVLLQLVRDSDKSMMGTFSDTLQGVIDKNPGVISNLNCFLNRAIRLPMNPEKEPLKISGPIFPKNFPCGFAPGPYTLYMFQKVPDDEELN
ncbi:Protein of unknown function, partial [Gryllus bimaculatus]